MSRHPISRTPRWPFVANLAGIRYGFREFDPRLVRGTRLGLIAIAGFSFAVTFSAGSRSPQRALPPTPVAERASAFAPGVASRFEAIRTLPDLLPAQAVAPTVTAPPRTATVRRAPARTPAPTSSAAVPAPPAAQPVRRPIVSRPTTPAPPRPAPPRPSPPAPPAQTFDSSGNTFDSSG
jgi:hypothetical protein